MTRFVADPVKRDMRAFLTEVQERKDRERIAILTMESKAEDMTPRFRMIGEHEAFRGKRLERLTQSRGIKTPYLDNVLSSVSPRESIIKHEWKKRTTEVRRHVKINGSVWYIADFAPHGKETIALYRYEGEPNSKAHRCTMVECKNHETLGHREKWMILHWFPREIMSRKGRALLIAQYGEIAGKTWHSVSELINAQKPVKEVKEETAKGPAKFIDQDKEKAVFLSTMLSLHFDGKWKTVLSYSTKLEAESREVFDRMILARKMLKIKKENRIVNPLWLEWKKAEEQRELVEAMNNLETVKDDCLSTIVAILRGSRNNGKFSGLVSRLERLGKRFVTLSGFLTHKPELINAVSTGWSVS